jgi:predicted RNA-binding Zn ribbon-like protein
LFTGYTEERVSNAAERWKFVGGRLCLDFINTVGGRVTRPGVSRPSPDYQDYVLRDRLKDYEELVQWSRESGDLTPAESRELRRLAQQKPAEAARAFERATTVREALYRMFKTVVEGWDPPEDDLDRFQSELAVAREHRELIKAKASFVWRWKTDPMSLDRPLWSILVSSEALLTAGILGKLRQCGGEECGWFFVDESRGGRRQWCEMRDCGNLAKVRRHRERNRQRAELESANTQPRRRIVAPDASAKNIEGSHAANVAQAE